MPTNPPTPARPKRTYTLHLNVALAARLEALCDLYPGKGREEVVMDLLDLGLSQVQQLWPHAIHGDAGLVPELGRDVYLPTGPFGAFHGLAKKHHVALSAPDLPGSAKEPSPPSTPSGLPVNP